MSRGWIRRLPAIFLLTLALPCFAGRVDIREGRFYVDDKPFYVRAVAYNPWRPHQTPGTSYTDTNRHWTEKDFSRIKAAHFNTLRTWEPLEPEQLALAQQYGLMVLQGIRLDPRQNFADPHNGETAAEEVRCVAENSKPFDNVLGYLVMSRADPAIVLQSGIEETRQFFRRLKRVIQTEDPRPVAMDRWWPLAFLDDPDSDFTAFNAFSFWPASLNYAMGYAGLIRWLSDHQSRDRPLLITETGGYAVSQATVTASGGFGGLPEYDQSLKDTESLRDTVTGHAQGAALVSWIDSWYFPTNADNHDNEPWEWTGILGIATDSKKDMEGVPRQLYADVKEYNQLIAIEPKRDHYYGVKGPHPIQVYGSPETVSLRYSLNGSDWLRLQGSNQGVFVGAFTLSKLARHRQRLALQALDRNDSVIAQKEISFVAALEPESVRLALNTRPGTKRLSFQVVVRDGDEQPLGHRKIFFGCFYPMSFEESQGTVVTDAAGLATFACPMPTHGSEDYLYAAAGTESPDHIRAGDLRIFELAPARL